MTTISISIPDQYVADLLVAFRDFLGEDADGLTDAQVQRKAIRRWVKQRVSAQRRRQAPDVTAAVATADSALAQKDAAAESAVQARKDAEETEDAAVTLAFGSDS